MGIPTINLVAVLHLYFIAVFIGVYASESVMELHSLFRKNDAEALRMTAKYHYWIDTLVEIPTVLGIVATGIWMAFLVEELTVLHWTLIGCVILMVPSALYCIFTVRKRYRVLMESGDEAVMRRHSLGIIKIIGTFFNPLMLAVIGLGFYLAHHRVLESIYG